MSNSKGLTLTMIFKANSANYGESIGNVSSLKKIVDVDGKQHTYISRQALRYNIINELDEPLSTLDVIGSKSKSVIQFAPDAKIDDYPELDFFGYMKTVKNSNGHKRSATVRLSHAMGQEEFYGDTDFLTNLSLADRLRKTYKKESDRNKIKNSIANSEINVNYYVYTVTIDLDQIGIDTETDSVISNEERSRRVQKLLTTIQYLYRDIRGRREDLKPLFVIGGLYKIKNPMFESVVHVKNNNVLIDSIQNVLEDPMIKDNTHVGLVNDIFANSDEIQKQLNAQPVPVIFNQLKKEVDNYYASNQD